MEIRWKYNVRLYQWEKGTEGLTAHPQPWQAYPMIKVHLSSLLRLTSLYFFPCESTFPRQATNLILAPYVDFSSRNWM